MDIYLAEAAILHVVLVGAGGTFFNEIMKNSPQWNILIVSGASSVSLGLLVRRQIFKARALTRKSKKTQS